MIKDRKNFRSFFCYCWQRLHEYVKYINPLEGYVTVIGINFVKFNYYLCCQSRIRSFNFLKTEYCFLRILPEKSFNNILKLRWQYLLVFTVFYCFWILSYTDQKHCMHVTIITIFYF